MDQPTHSDELLGGQWLPTWSEEDDPYPPDAVDELQALLAQLADALVD